MLAMEQETKVKYYSDEVHEDFANNGIKAKKVDSNYKYINKNPFSIFFGNLLLVLLFPIAKFVAWMLYHPKFVGKKEVLRKVKKQGYYIYSNHVLEVDPLIIPTYSKEKHGVVFRMKDRNSDLEYNVKCFTDEQEGRETLYEQINNSQGVWFPNGVTYYANELFVDTAVSDANEFPVVVIPCCKTTNLISFINTNIAA